MLLFQAGSWRDQLMRKTLRDNVDKVLAITKTHAAEVALPKRTIIVPNWSDFAGRSEKIDLRQSYGIPPKHKVILCMGERQPHKGSLTAIEAFCQLDNSNAILLVLGGKPSGGLLKRTIRQTLNTLRIPTYGLRLDWAAAKNPDKIRLAGSSLNVQSLMAQSAFLISPFIRPHFAKTVIEAASLGKTSILSAGAPQDESIIDGKTGILVPPGDSAALAKAMERLLKHPEEAERMGAAAKEFVSERYNKEHSIKLIRKAYED
jgi:glycosyltransferase involved in cell wall biosynthesis